MNIILLAKKTLPFFLILLSVMLILLPIETFSQKHFTRQYTMKDGLPSNAIRSIFKDSRGLMWIGTDAGVCCYDGREFVTYTSRDGLAGNKVWSITEDGEGCLWMGSFGGGISRFNGHEFTNITSENDLMDNYVRVIRYFSAKNLLMVGTQKGLQVFEQDTSYIIDATIINPDNPDLVILDIVQEGDFFYIMVYNRTPGTYYIYDPLTRQYTFHPEAFSHEIAQSIRGFISSKGDTVVGPRRTGCRIITKTSVQNFPEVGQIFDIKEDGDQNVWIAAWTDNTGMSGTGGFFRFDGKNLERFNDRLSIESPFGYSMYYDEEQHLLWLGTLDKGLFLHPESRFEYYEAAGFGLKESLMNDLYYDKHANLWVACDSGVIKRDRYGEVKVFPKKNFLDVLRAYIYRNSYVLFNYKNDPHGSFEKYNDLRDDNGISLPNPYLEMKGFKPNVLPEGSNYVPDEYRIIQQQMKRTGSIPFNERFTGFRFIGGNSRDEIWVSSEWGSWRSDPQYRNFAGYTTTNLQNFIFDEKDTVFSSGYWNVHLDIIPDISHSLHMFRLSPKNYEVPHFVLKTFRKGNEIWYGDRLYGLFVSRDGFYKSINKSNPRIPEYIHDICTDTEGNLIFCGNSGEIFIGKFQDDSLQIRFQISDKTGLIGSAVQWILAGPDHMLYASTNMGLNVIDLTVLYKDGILAKRFFDADEGYINPAAQSPVMDENGIIWCANGTNLLCIDTKKLLDTTCDPLPIRLTGTEIHHQVTNTLFSQEYGLFDLRDGKVPRLKHNWNYITFSFSCLNYLNPAKDVFRYRLNGLTDDWSEFQGQNLATFTDLHPGKYILEVEGRNLASGLEHKPLKVSFFILRPWWNQVWFYVLLGCIFLFGIWLIIFLRTRAVRKKEQLRSEISRQLAELEMKALQSQMNPHFVFNAINSIQSFILDNNVDKALSYLSDFSQIIRQTLENATRKYITVAEELGYIGHYLNLEQMRFRNKFEVRIQVSDELDPETVLIPPMLLQPYIENSIRHGLMHKESKGNLLLKIEQEAEKELVCMVEDDGVGRVRAGELENWMTNNHHKSYGMKLVQDRISLLNRTGSEHRYDIEVVDLYDDHGQATGTRVVIRLPYLTEH